MVSVQSATSNAFNQLQLQQAQNRAQQLEAKSEALAAQASSARREAGAANRRADELGTLADGAKSEANAVNMAVSSAQGFDRVAQKVTEQVASLGRAAAAQSEPEGALTYSRDASTSPVFTIKTGQIINDVA